MLVPFRFTQLGYIDKTCTISRAINMIKLFNKLKVIVFFAFIFFFMIFVFPNKSIFSWTVCHLIWRGLCTVIKQRNSQPKNVKPKGMLRHNEQNKVVKLKYWYTCVYSCFYFYLFLTKVFILISLFQWKLFVHIKMTDVILPAIKFDRNY